MPSHLPRAGRPGEVSARTRSVLPVMDEDRFWDLMAATGGRRDPAGLDSLLVALRRLEPEEIRAFSDRLAEVRHRMDLHSIARQPWSDVSDPDWVVTEDGYLSADGFLYARCDAVAHGRATVEGILADHRRFARPWDGGAERLLYLAVEAWEATTGRAWDYDRRAPVSYETGSNPAGGWVRDGFPPGNPQ